MQARSDCLRMPRSEPPAWAASLREITVRQDYTGVETKTNGAPLRTPQGLGTKLKIIQGQSIRGYFRVFFFFNYIRTLLKM